jgi:hypothetical protein
MDVGFGARGAELRRSGMAAPAKDRDLDPTQFTDFGEF